MDEDRILFAALPESANLLAERQVVEHEGARAPERIPCSLDDWHLPQCLGGLLLRELVSETHQVVFHPENEKN